MTLSQNVDWNICVAVTHMIIISILVNNFGSSLKLEVCALIYLQEYDISKEFWLKLMCLSHLHDSNIEKFSILVNSFRPFWKIKLLALIHFAEFIVNKHRLQKCYWMPGMKHAWHLLDYSVTCYVAWEAICICKEFWEELNIFLFL